MSNLFALLWKKNGDFVLKTLLHTITSPLLPKVVFVSDTSWPYDDYSYHGYGLCELVCQLIINESYHEALKTCFFFMEHHVWVHFF